MFRKFFFRRPSFANSLILQFGLLMLLALAVFAAGSYRLIVRPTVDDLARAQMGLVSAAVGAGGSMAISITPPLPASTNFSFQLLPIMTKYRPWFSRMSPGGKYCCS